MDKKLVLGQADRLVDRQVGGTSHTRGSPSGAGLVPAEMIAEGFSRGKFSYAKLVGGKWPHIRIYFANGRVPAMPDAVPAMVEQVISARPALSFRAMAAQLGCSYTQHQRVLRELAKRGLIHPARRGEAAVWKGR